MARPQSPAAGTRLESADGAGDARVSQLTGAAAEYLMTIRYMHGEGQPVIAARLAERLGVSAATVSEMVTRLVREGLLTVDADSRQLEPDRCRPHGRRAHLPSPRAVGVAADRGRRPGLGRGRRGGPSPPERVQRPRHRSDRRAARAPAHLSARQPDSPGRAHPRAPRRTARCPTRPRGGAVTILRVTEEAEEDARLLTFLQENGVRPGHVFEVRRGGRAHRHDDAASGRWWTMDGHEVTIGLVAAAKLRMLDGRADPSLFHRVPERARLATAG